MTGDQATLGHWGGVEHVPGEGLDDDPTPRGAVGAVLGSALADPNTAPELYAKLCAVGMYAADPSCPHIGPLRVLDVGAGYGCWSSQMRKLAAEMGWPVHITGVEINPEREQHLAKWCDEAVIDDWRAALTCRDCDGAGQYYARTGFCQSDVDAFDCEGCGGRGGRASWDLIIGNPPFAHVLRQGKTDDGKRTDYMPVDETMVPTLLRHAPAVLLLHTAGAFDDSEHGREVWRRYPPAAVWLCGRLSFRAGSATDSRTYYATLWLRDHEGPAQLHMLPTLAPEDRRWTVPPGSESRDVARALGLPMVGE